MSDSNDNTKQPEVSTIPQDKPVMGLETVILPVPRKYKTFPKKTELSTEQLSNLIVDIANDVAMWKLVRTYHMGKTTINDIKIRNCRDIERVRCVIAAEHEKVFARETVLKRSKILNSIEEKDIKKASLHAKTGAIVDLTNVKRLELGQSTSNVALISKDMSDDALREYIIDGSYKDDTSGKQTQ